MALELILQEIELSDNTINDNTFDIWYNKGIFLAIENVKGGRTFKYKLTDNEESIFRLHRQEILSYRLSVVTREDEVIIGDVFMHGKFIEKIQ